MKGPPWGLAENYRMAKAAGYESKFGDAYGIFRIPMNGIHLLCMVGLPDEDVPWEHVSVSGRKRVPNWYEMCAIKDLFWREDETVMQLHVPPTLHINYHQHTLHLWRPINAVIPLPPLEAV